MPHWHTTTRMDRPLLLPLLRRPGSGSSASQGPSDSAPNGSLPHRLWRDGEAAGAAAEAVAASFSELDETLRIVFNLCDAIMLGPHSAPVLDLGWFASGELIAE